MNTKIPGLGIAHLALKAVDFEKSYKFYTEGLGMTPYVSWGEGEKHIQLLKFGNGGMLELFAAAPEAEVNNSYPHFAYSVEDVDAAFETALAAGAKPKIYPKSVPLDSEPKKTTIRIAFVYGPSGEEIEFFKEVE